MFEGHDQAICDLLSARRLITAGVWHSVAADGQPAVRGLLERGLIAEDALLEAIASQWGYDWSVELPVELDPEVVGLVSASFAQRHGVVPLGVVETRVSLAVMDPFAPELAGDLAFALGREVRITVADPQRVQRLMHQHYGADAHELAEGAGGFAEGKAESIDDAALTEVDLAQMAGQERVIRFVNSVLARSVRDGAADVHFEPFEHEFRVRYRVDGALKELPSPPRALTLPVISRLKVLANVNIAERRVPQDGRIRLALGGRAVDLRLSTLPTQFGESVVLRVLDQSAGRLDLGELGLPEAVRTKIEEIVERPHGIFIVTGPTGSGKTTTLYSCLKELNAPEVKVLTVEDPVEYEIEGLMQVPVNLAAGLTFSRALRSFLRQDPDVVMVGEVRDAETAQIAIQAALTGHLVLTTLHTNDAASAVTRLVDMGVEPFLLASSVEAVLAQRLLRRICPACRVAYAPADSLLGQLGVSPGEGGGAGVKFYRAQGCAECGQSGYRGRLGLFEFLPMTDALREQIVKGSSLLDLKRAAVAEGLVTLREAGVKALMAGETSVEEVMKYI